MISSSFSNLLLISFQASLICFLLIQPFCGQATQQSNVQGIEAEKRAVLGIDLKSLFGFGSKSPDTNLIASSSDGSSHQQRLPETSLVPFDISVLGDKTPSENIVGPSGGSFGDESSDYDFMYNTMPPKASAPIHSFSRISPPKSYHIHAPFSIPSNNHNKYHYGNNFMDTNKYPGIHTKYQDPEMNEINVIPSWLTTSSRSRSGGRRAGSFSNNFPLRYEERDALNDFLLGMVRGPFPRTGATVVQQEHAKKRGERGEVSMNRGGKSGMHFSRAEEVIIPNDGGISNKNVPVGSKGREWPEVDRGQRRE